VSSYGALAVRCDRLELRLGLELAPREVSGRCWPSPAAPSSRLGLLRVRDRGGSAVVDEVAVLGGAGGLDRAAAHVLEELDRVGLR
jgi:hypothetical protein